MTATTIEPRQSNFLEATREAWEDRLRTLAEKVDRREVLTDDEKRYLDHVLYELRMNYVDETERPAESKPAEEEDAAAGLADFSENMSQLPPDPPDEDAFVEGQLAGQHPAAVLSGDPVGVVGEQLQAALMAIATEGRGALLYLRQEGRGIGLVNKLKAYRLQDEEGMDTVEANQHLGFKSDLRDYGIGAQILRDLGVKKMGLLTNNPKKIVRLEGYGIEVVQRLPLEMQASNESKGYLMCKRDRMGHLIEVDD